MIVASSASDLVPERAVFIDADRTVDLTKSTPDDSSSTWYFGYRFADRP